VVCGIGRLLARNAANDEQVHALSPPFRYSAKPYESSCAALDQEKIKREEYAQNYGCHYSVETAAYTTFKVTLHVRLPVRYLT